MKYWIAILLMVCGLNAEAQKLNEAYLRARAAMYQKTYQKATEEILSVPESERSPAMYFSLGESYYQLQNYDEAVRSFETSESTRSTPETQLYIAKAYAMMMQPAKAVEWLEKYLGQRNKLPESDLHLDPSFEKIERSKEWRTLWDKSWYNAAEEKSAEADLMIKRKKYTEALNIIDGETVRRTPSARLLIQRAKAYAAMEEYVPAFESYQAALQLRGNQSEYFSDAAEVAIKVNKYDMALDYLDKAIRIDPYSLELYLQRASTFRMLKRYDEAREDINFFFAYLPADTKALYQMGVNELEAGNTLSGIEYFTLLIDQDRSKVDYFLARASAYSKAQKFGMADDDLAQVLDLDPRKPEAWLQKGIVHQQMGDMENACYYWRKALNLGSKEASNYIYKYCTQ
ncbi:MAG: tetratricopeptide repeat protein [Bacteroidales bacterium]|nr:tetratricopeptide repeat protein [Bacteroidales bacterium]